MKNTIISWILDLLCPHTCLVCGEIGGVLCECCKNNILDFAEKKRIAIFEKNPTISFLYLKKNRLTKSIK